MGNRRRLDAFTINIVQKSRPQNKLFLAGFSAEEHQGNNIRILKQKLKKITRLNQAKKSML